MFGNSYGAMVGPLGINWFSGIGGALLVLLVIWSLIWKGLALWKSARRGSNVWFIVLLIVNTLGILEILYLYVFSEMKRSKPVHEHNPEHHGHEKKEE